MLADFPVKGGEGIYRSKVRKFGKDLRLMVHQQMVRDMELTAGTTYLCKAKRISDAYSEEGILLELEAYEDKDYPLTARLPSYTMLASGNKLYIMLEPFDLTRWFRNKKSKGFAIEEAEA